MLKTFTVNDPATADMDNAYIEFQNKLCRAIADHLENYSLHGEAAEPLNGIMEDSYELVENDHSQLSWIIAEIKSDKPGLSDLIDPILSQAEDEVANIEHDVHRIIEGSCGLKLQCYCEIANLSRSSGRLHFAWRLTGAMVRDSF